MSHPYTPERKQALDRVLKVFEPFIRESRQLDVVWSDKVGYIMLYLTEAGNDIRYEPQILSTPRELCTQMYWEISKDLLTQNNRLIQPSEDLDSAIRHRLAPYAAQLPEYQSLAEKVLLKNW